MTEQSPAPPTEHGNQSQDVPPTKPTQWSRSEILSLCALILALFSFLFGPGVLKGFLPSDAGNQAGIGESAGIAHFEGMISIVNVVLACSVLIYIYLKRTKLLHAKQPISPLAKKALAQFLSAWMWVWASWAVLYFWLALVWLLPLYNQRRVWPWIVADFLNMLTGCAMFFLFLVLDMPSVKTTTIQSPLDKATTDQPRDLQFWKNVKIVFAVGFLLFLVETVTIIIRKRTSSMDSPDVLLKNLVAAFTAVGMAFFIGRLDSHYLKAPRIVLAPLYLYVIIQLSWNNIASSQTSADDPTRAIILGLACYFKFLLFWVVRSWLADGSMARYLENAEHYYSAAS